MARVCRYLLQGGIIMMKKVLHGLLVMSAAAVISVGASSYDADAAGITPGSYTVDYANQQIKVTAVDANTKIYVAKATVTVKTDKKTGASTMAVKNAAATEYDAKAGMLIDISSFPVTKDTYLSIWGNKTTDPTLIKLPAATTKMKAVVDATDATVAINNTTDPKNPVEISGTEFCTTNGVWTDYTKAAAGATKATTAKTTDVKLTGYADLGATLRFRVKASANATLPKATEIGKDDQGKAVMACVATGNFASNEVKAKIAKTANGPKATIDYNKRTITVPANTTEYRVQAAVAALGNFVKATGEARTVTIDYTTLKSTNATPAKLEGKTVEFDLRTAAAGNKPASKITEYTFSPVATLTGGNAAANNNPATKDVTNTANTIKIGTSKNAEDIKVTKLTLNSKTMKGTMTITNNTAEAYEFVVESAQTAATVGKLTLPAADAKVKGKVAAANSKTGKAGTANIAVESGQYVYIRKAADTKKMVWSTPYIFYGVVGETL